MRLLGRLATLQTVAALLVASMLVFALGAGIDLPSERVPAWAAGVLLCLAGFALGRAFSLATFSATPRPAGIGLRRMESEIDALRIEVRRLSDSRRA